MKLEDLTPGSNGRCFHHAHLLPSYMAFMSLKSDTGVNFSVFWLLGFYSPRLKSSNIKRSAIRWQYIKN